jgi:hypothetical protein
LPPHVPARPGRAMTTAAAAETMSFFMGGPLVRYARISAPVHSIYGRV